MFVFVGLDYITYTVVSNSIHLPEIFINSLFLIAEWYPSV